MLSAAIVSLSPSVIYAADAADPVAKALAAVRDVKADMFSTQSSVLGPLPGPAELAAAQPNLREMLRPTGPAQLTFSAAQRDQYVRNYKYFTFVGRGREADCFPIGNSGVHARDIRSRTELIVVAIEPGSPADGKVRVDDIIIGANGGLFDDPMDPRPAMGFAVLESHTAKLGGKLTLQILRAGQPMNVEVNIGVNGDYSPTWPMNCEKTRRLAAAALACVKRYAPPADKLFSLHSGGGFWTPLFLMASGDDEAMEWSRRWAHAAAAGDLAAAADSIELSEPGGSCWTLSYRLVNLCEYYLHTGDSLVLPSIRKHAAQLSLNQYPVGTWGHGVPSGYGPINNVGLVVFTGLILARECGVEVSPAVMARAIRFFGKFCGTNFPYGEGTPGGQSGRMDNGMNSMAAVAFNLLGERDMAVRWARSVCYMWLARERGHAEGIFSWSWGPLGAALSPGSEFHMFMANTLWFYELMNTRDGGFVFTRYGSAGGGRFSYAVGTTSAIALPLYLPKHRLRIMGAPRGVFGTRPPGELKGAAEQFRHKRWKELTASLAAYLADKSKPDRKYAQGLLDAYRSQQEQVDYTLEQVKSNIAKGGFRLAGLQLESIRRLLGGDRAEMAGLRASIAAGLAKGARPRIEKKVPLAQVKPQTSLYGPKSATRGGNWQVLLPLAGDRSVKTLDYLVRIGRGTESTAPGPWCDLSYKPTGWTTQTGPVKLAAGRQVWLRRAFTMPAGKLGAGTMRVSSTGVGEVYLNGYRLAQVRPGNVDLRPGLGALVHGGPNILTARMTAGRGAVDVSLKFSGRQIPKLGDIRLNP